MSYTLPINNNVVRPSTSSQYENGKFPATALVQVPNVKTTCLMEPTAARAFTACFDLAQKMLGITIKDVGDFRTFQGQMDLFIDKGPNTPGRYIQVTVEKYQATAPEHRKTWADAQKYGYWSVWWIKNYAKFGYWPATAASPGTSNHGYGLALDVAQEYDGDSDPDPITEVFVGWLCVHGPKFGIYATLSSEKWHWQYNLGDDLPQAVLDYESGNGNGESDMDLIEREIRLYDSRPVTAFSGKPLDPNQVLTLNISDHKGATAAVVNVTVDKTVSGGWLSKKLPTSCLNWYGPNQTICNEVTVFLNADGQFVIINGPTPTHIIVDLVGLWVPST